MKAHTVTVQASNAEFWLFQNTGESLFVVLLAIKIEVVLNKQTRADEELKHCNTNMTTNKHTHRRMMIDVRESSTYK